MIDQIRSAIDPFLLVLRLTILSLRSAITAWSMFSDISWWTILKPFFQMAVYYSKLLVKEVAQAWRTPISKRARRTYKQHLTQLTHFIGNRTLTKERWHTSNIQIVRLILRAVFDRVTIQHISTFAARMGLCQLVEGRYVITHGLAPQDAISLMEQRVPAVCISYKHTRRSREGLPQDIARVHRAVTQAASQLSQNRLLFWCDVIGHSPDGVSWAEQGIDPYLCMPTLRIVSAELREEIANSFWMTVERMVARFRGGMFSYDEDEGRLRLWPRNDGYFVSFPDFSRSFDVSKLGLAKLICNPILYYRRARYENDKLEVMKYAMSAVTLGRMNLYGLQQNEEKLLKLVSRDDVMNVASVIMTDNAFLSSDAFGLTRPQTETLVGEGEGWNGLEEPFPAIRIVEPESRQYLIRAVRKPTAQSAFWIRPVSDAVENITDLIYAPLGNIARCSALRLRVVGFEEHENRVTGRVVSFRVATEAEEESVTFDSSIRKQVCFH